MSKHGQDLRQAWATSTVSVVNAATHERIFAVPYKTVGLHFIKSFCTACTTCKASCQDLIVLSYRNILEPHTRCMLFYIYSIQSLHTKLEVPRLTYPGRESNPGRHDGSTLEKSHSNSLFNCYSEPLQFYSNLLYLDFLKKNLQF